ncbi:hypothetical protein NA57DRAFT_37949 [Rhizodiscina lignyota]|uniref:Anaphase-promoting complex subunit 2 n=1 Tax=Rhizodiscina lignyota TaxID=1504668 RepID=A0A9P4M745_9PEZI|nr:hypothetical protein NA57DRAFT_37949 [Rhizodiscina lignyota]
MSKSALVFASIFPQSTATHTTPTPQATPDLGFTVPGQPFGGPSPPSLRQTQSRKRGQNQPSSQTEGLTAAQHAVRRNLAWSTATQFLSLQGAPVPGGQARHADARRSSDVQEALAWLLLEDEVEDESQMGLKCVGLRKGSNGLLNWYFEEVKLHFLGTFKPQLDEEMGRIVDVTSAWASLANIATAFGAVEQMYMQPVTNHIAPILAAGGGVNDELELHDQSDTPASRLVQHFERNLHTLFTQSLDPKARHNALALVFRDAGQKLFRLDASASVVGQLPGPGSANDPSAVINQLKELLLALNEVGLAGDDAQRAFAAAVDRLMDDFVESWHVKVDWYRRCSVMPKLRRWVDEGLARYVSEVMSCIETKQWSDMAVTRLGRARVANLFDYVIRWDTSIGAILDLKEYIATPGARIHLSTNFSQQLQRRLLHAGATTIQILDTYIYVIRAFNELDPKGKDFETEQNISVEVAKEMLNPISDGSHEYDQDLDWGNMAWVPDPHDAGPDYKRSKSEDILSSLLSLYDREDFINELKNILGDHLLKSKNSEFEKEFQLLELFKIRLGDDKLQACEVMLHDVEDSKHINTAIHNDPVYAATTVAPEVSLSTQILSSYFWPPLREESFAVPAPVAQLQEAYESGFRALKDMRRLKWLQALGRVGVELELEDRKVELEVLPWQASVIYAFQDEEEGTDSAKRTVSELVETLEMDETLVRQAVAFWMGKLVLEEVAPDTYSVLEILPASATSTSAQEAAAAAAEAAGKAAAVKSPEDILMENMQMYRQFILGMLTNQGKMDVKRMHMMLKMVVPGGFGFGLDELRTLLQRMGIEGLVNGEGDSWSIVK